VNEAGKGFLATGEHLGVTGLDLFLRLSVDLAVVQRRTPVGRALEHGETADLGRNRLDGLYARCTRADHGDALASEIDRLVRPAHGMESLSGEALTSFDQGPG